VAQSVQIDHVLASSGGRRLRVLASRVAAGPISDHRALVVDLEAG
jgi:endonuclease/exonuclease/phosphatase family metal-dependent hydrolase